MPVPFFLAALLGKAAAAVLGKGFAAKGMAAHAKAYGGHHGQHALARKVAGKVIERAVDQGVESALKPNKRDEKSGKAKKKGSSA